MAGNDKRCQETTTYKTDEIDNLCFVVKTRTRQDFDRNIMEYRPIVSDHDR